MSYIYIYHIKVETIINNIFKSHLSARNLYIYCHMGHMSYILCPMSYITKVNINAYIYIYIYIY